MPPPDPGRFTQHRREPIERGRLTKPEPSVRTLAARTPAYSAERRDQVPPVHRRHRPAVQRHHQRCGLPLGHASMVPGRRRPSLGECLLGAIVEREDDPVLEVTAEMPGGVTPSGDALGRNA